MGGACRLTGSGSPELPQPLIEQLADPGKMIIPVGDQHLQVLQLVSKEGGEITITDLERVRFVDLVGQYGWR